MRDIEVLQVTASLLIVPSSVHAILRWEEKHLPPEQLDRAWPLSTRLSAVLGAFLMWGPFCLPIHFWRTRRSFRGILIGVLVTTGVIALSIAAQLLIELVLGD